MDELMRWTYVATTHPITLLLIVDITIWGFILRDVVVKAVVR